MTEIDTDGNYLVLELGVYNLVKCVLRCRCLTVCPPFTVTTAIAMAGFLRKKNKVEDKKNRPPAEPTFVQQQSSSSSSPIVPPLYARFATSSSQSSDAATASTSRPMVSGPMSLASAKKPPSGQGSPERGGGASNSYGRNGNNAKWNGSGPDLRMKREQSGQSNQSVASGSGYFPPTSARDPYALPTPQFPAANGSTSKLGGGSPAAYGSSLGLGSVSRASLDKPLPPPKPDPQPVRQPPPTPRIRDPTLLPTREDKPLPTPGPVLPASLIPEASPSFASEAKQSRAAKRLSDDLSNYDAFSPYPDIRTGDRKASNATKIAHTNAVSSPFASNGSSQQARPSSQSGYPKDLVAQLQSIQPPSQPIFSEPSSSYPSSSPYTNSRPIPPATTYPSNPPLSQPVQTRPPSPKKSGLPSLKGRLSFSLRSPSPSKPPSPSKLQKVPSRASPDRLPFDVDGGSGLGLANGLGSGSGLPPGAAAAIPMTASSSGHSGNDGPNPKRISLDDPFQNEGRTRGSLEQPRGEVSNCRFACYF